MHRCQGYNVNQPSHNLYTVKNRSYNYNCLGRYSAYTAVVFPKYSKKSDDEYMLLNSFFQFKQQAIALHRNRLTQWSSYFNLHNNDSESDERDIDSITDDYIRNINNRTDPIELNSAPNVLKFIKSAPIASKLKEFRSLFNNRTSLQFYTDGSLKHLDQALVHMGCAWIETSNPGKYRFSAQCTDYASSSRAEAMAILAALLTAPQYCYVTIYTDSAVCIQLLEQLKSNPHHINGKSANQIIWCYIKWICQVLNLHIFAVKVKAYDTDQLNNETDRLAKEAYKNDLPVFFIDHSFTFHYPILVWNKRSVEFNHREFINSLYQAQLFNRYISFQRNRNLYNVTKKRFINWFLVNSYMAYDD